MPAEDLFAKEWDYSAASRNHSVRYVTATPRERVGKGKLKAEIVDDSPYRQ